jgi:hypothetical protein
MSTGKQRSIVCSAGEVRGLLDGRVSLLVRAINPQPVIRPGWTNRAREGAENGVSFAADTANEYTVALSWIEGWQHDIARKLCYFGKPGERCRVRETWAISVFVARGKNVRIAYRAECDDEIKNWHNMSRPFMASLVAGEVLNNGWRAATQMPAWASRLSVQVGTVRVERLQDLTEEDAKAAGGAPFEEAFPRGEMLPGATSYRASFSLLWDDRHGKRSSWASNPWGWLIVVKTAGVRA